MAQAGTNCCPREGQPGGDRSRPGDWSAGQGSKQGGVDEGVRQRGPAILVQTRLPAIWKPTQCVSIMTSGHSSLN